MPDKVKTLLPGRTHAKAKHYPPPLMVKPKRAKLTQALTENTSKKDGPESSTQTTARKQPVLEPSVSTQLEEKNPVEDVGPATKAIHANAIAE
ncbi:hypothetical protein F2Q68_00020204 [Brassica cretica]|uniref:Uncharacterized protein n=1 Tax=Brassica cretica TaxID=69181 RepID=A0A8S9FT68_BRACR|nr:hypothetical protein F2Q68_00020204 [Brassica cretica]